MQVEREVMGTPVLEIPGQDGSRSIDWYGEGQSRTVRIGDVEITVRFIGRKGRRGRIAISAPPGSTFFEC